MRRGPQPPRPLSAARAGRSRRADLSAAGEAIRALLVRKEVTVFPEMPCFLLLVEAAGTAWDLERSYLRTQHVFTLLGLPANSLIVGHTEGGDGWKRRSLGCPAPRSPAVPCPPARTDPPPGVCDCCRWGRLLARAAIL
jgi:hypothetical protein